MTRLTFNGPYALLCARRKFVQLHRLAKQIDGFLYARSSTEGLRTLMTMSMWDSEFSVINFTTLNEHVEAVRWTIRAKADVWSGMFEHRTAGSPRLPRVGLAELSSGDRR